MSKEYMKEYRKKLTIQGYTKREIYVHITELEKFLLIKKLFKKYQENKNFNINDSFFDQLVNILDNEQEKK